jgi:hypothetical protein
MTDELTGTSRCTLACRALLMSPPDYSLIAFDPFVKHAAKIVVGNKERQARKTVRLNPLA